jgi:hypothetical protein
MAALSFEHCLHKYRIFLASFRLENPKVAGFANSAFEKKKG